MTNILPRNLLEAESFLKQSLFQSLAESNSKFLSLNLNFQNIRINPIVFRLAEQLRQVNIGFYILWSDEGSSALAKRDLNEYKEYIYSYNQFSKNIVNLNHDKIILAVCPQPFDFEQFKELCNQYSGRIVMLNGKLEDMAIGIGNLGRERRKEFINAWEQIFWLQPLSKGALMKLYGYEWELFRLDEEGYRYCQSFKLKPDDETILETLSDLSK